MPVATSSVARSCVSRRRSNAIHQDMDDAGYQPPADFVEDKKDPLVDFELTDSTELWLIQWPIHQPCDFDGQRVSLKLDGDGQIGTFEGLSGKSYDVFSYKSQGPEASVILSSASEPKIAGKISRRVSLIHFPDPSELLKRNNLDFGQSQRSSMATSSMSAGIRPKNSQGMSGYSTPISRTKSTISGMGDHSKRKRVDDHSKSTKRKRVDDHSNQDSGKGNSGVTSTGSMEHTTKKKKKIEK